MAVEYYSPDQENGANRVPVPAQINAVAANAGVPNAIATNAARVRAVMAAAELARANAVATQVPEPVPEPVVMPVQPSEVVVAVEIVAHTNEVVPAVLPVLPSEDVVVAEEIAEIVVVVEEIAEIVPPTESAAPAPRGLPPQPTAAAAATATAPAAGAGVGQTRPAMFVKNKSRRVRPTSNRPTAQRALFQDYSSLSTSTSVSIIGKK